MRSSAHWLYIQWNVFTRDTNGTKVFWQGVLINEVGLLINHGVFYIYMYMWFHFRFKVGP